MSWHVILSVYCLGDEAARNHCNSQKLAWNFLAENGFLKISTEPNVNLLNSLIEKLDCLFCILGIIEADIELFSSKHCLGGQGRMLDFLLYLEQSLPLLLDQLWGMDLCNLVSGDFCRNRFGVCFSCPATVYCWRVGALCASSDMVHPAFDGGCCYSLLRCWAIA